MPIERCRGLSFRRELESFGDLEPTRDQHTQIYLADLLEYVLSQNLHTNAFSDLTPEGDTRSLSLHEKELRTPRAELGLPTAAKTAYQLFSKHYRDQHDSPTPNAVNEAWRAYKATAQATANQTDESTDFEAQAARQRLKYLSDLEAWQKQYHSVPSQAPWLRLDTVTTTTITNTTTPTPAPPPAAAPHEHVAPSPAEILALIQQTLRLHTGLPPIRMGGPPPDPTSFRPPHGRGRVTTASEATGGQQQQQGALFR